MRVSRGPFSLFVVFEKSPRGHRKRGGLPPPSEGIRRLGGARGRLSPGPDPERPERPLVAPPGRLRSTLGPRSSLTAWASRLRSGPRERRQPRGARVLTDTATSAPGSGTRALLRAALGGTMSAVKAREAGAGNHGLQALRPPPSQRRCPGRTQGRAARTPGGRARPRRSARLPARARTCACAREPEPQPGLPVRAARPRLFPNVSTQKLTSIAAQPAPRTSARCGPCASDPSATPSASRER